MLNVITNHYFCLFNKVRSKQRSDYGTYWNHRNT